MQFRKCTSLFLAILLLISNLGLAFNVHYCGDKIASFSSVFSTIENKKNDDSPTNNCCCVNKNKNTCCKDKVVDLKKDTKEIIVKTFSFQIDGAITIIKLGEIDFLEVEKITLTSDITGYYCSPNAPPLFKLYQQYIFYA